MRHPLRHGHVQIPHYHRAGKEGRQGFGQDAGVTDYKAVGIAMFTAKSSVDGVSAKDHVSRDIKNFSMSGKKVGNGQIEVFDLSMLDKAKEDLIRKSSASRLKAATAFSSC